jgi:hypothetical protein
MSDFLMNLARRAVGEKANGAEIAPSPHAALAEQMALPSVVAPEPAPPAITAAPPAATARVMREAAQPPVTPAAAPPPAAVPAPIAPAATQPEISRPSVYTQPQPVIPASTERGEAVVTVVPASPQDPNRSIELSNAGPLHAEARAPDVSLVAAPVSTPPVEEPAEVVVRYEPRTPAAEMSGVALASPAPEAPQTLAPPDAPRSRVQSPTARPAALARVEGAPLERAPVVPRVERPPDAVVPFARRETATATAETTVAQGARPAVTAQRPVHVRIGAIEVHVTAAAPPAPSERPALAGFEEYGGLRNHVRYDGE